MAEMELKWYREHINIEPPLSEICTPEDVDRFAINTIKHDFVYSPNEMQMPFAIIHARWRHIMLVRGLEG